MSNTRDPQLDALLQAASRPRPELDALAEVASGLGYVRAERFAERVYESLFYAIATGRSRRAASCPPSWNWPRCLTCRARSCARRWTGCARTSWWTRGAARAPMCAPSPT